MNEYNFLYNDIPSIELSTAEIELFEHLNLFISEVNPLLTIRVAGGWVRDKLLNLPTTDLDLALDEWTGVQFAEYYTEWIQKRFNLVTKWACVKQNPEQSKHLETVKMRIKKLDLDIVHLRNELYNKDSRIPIVNIGSPKEDAFRRDFTINSMFYNINLNKIEDFTGQGFLHLQKRKIVTPSPALDTFMEDPLRVLRAVRFSVTLKFDLDESIIEAARTSCVQQQFQNKVSRERIGVELDKMLKFDCVHALILLCEVCNFGSCVFLLENDKLQSGQNVVKNFIKSLESEEEIAEIVKNSKNSEELKLVLIYSCIYSSLELHELEEKFRHAFRTSKKRIFGCKRLLHGVNLWKQLLDEEKQINSKTFPVGVTFDINDPYVDENVLIKLTMRFLTFPDWEFSLFLTTLILPQLLNKAKELKEHIKTQILPKYQCFQKLPIDGYELQSILPKAKGEQIKLGLDYALILSLANNFKNKELSKRLRQKFPHCA